MSAGVCPKCGRETPSDAVICTGCDYILDASFLGDDITDKERDSRPGVGGLHVAAEEAFASEFGDVMILGQLDDQAVESFSTRDTGMHASEATHARIYIGGVMQELLDSNAVPAMVKGLEINGSLKFTPFERHVLGYVDGKRTIRELRELAGLDENDFYTSMALLADKGFIALAGKDDAVAFDEDRAAFDAGAMISEAPSGSMAPVASDESLEEIEPHDVFSVPAAGPLDFADSLASREDDEPIDFELPPTVPPRPRESLVPPLPDAENFHPPTNEVAELDTNNGLGSEVETQAPTQDLPSVVSIDISLHSVPPEEAVEAFGDHAAPVIDLPGDDESATGDALAPPPLPGDASMLSELPLEIVDEAPAPVPVAEVKLKKVSPAAVAKPAAAEPSPSVPHAMRSKADKLFAQALKDKAAGRLSSALMNAKIALVHNPYFSEAKQAIEEWNSLPTAHKAAAARERVFVEEARRMEGKGMYEEALALMNKALDISPNVAAVHNMKGVLLATRLKRYAEASASLMRAVELAPNNVTYKNNLGKVMVKEEENYTPKNEGFFGHRKKQSQSNVVVKKLRPKVF